MKKLIIIALILSSLSVIAQNESSILWRISGNGLKEPSFLFGSMHIVPGKQFFINETISNCFKNVKTLIVETDPKITLDDHLKTTSLSMLPKGKTIKDFMDKDTYNECYTYWTDSMKVNKNQLNKMLSYKPIFLSSFLMSQYIVQPKNYESEFFNLAGKSKKLITLETLEEQISMMDSIPISDQLSEYNADQQYFELLDLYLKQDIHGIENLLLDETSMDFKTLMIQMRTNNWLPKINEAINRESCFISVGLAHIIGENGFISILRKTGYTVEPIHQSLIKK
jgi:uncharacterized protein YbaP (TraB family)